MRIGDGNGRDCLLYTSDKFHAYVCSEKIHQSKWTSSYWNHQRNDFAVLNFIIAAPENRNTSSLADLTTVAIIHGIWMTLHSRFSQLLLLCSLFSRSFTRCDQFSIHRSAFSKAHSEQDPIQSALSIFLHCRTQKLHFSFVNYTMDSRSFVTFPTHSISVYNFSFNSRNHAV